MTLVGRGPEVRQLEAALDRLAPDATASDTAVSAAASIGIRIEGPAGIGKSTLLRPGNRDDQRHRGR